MKESPEAARTIKDEVNLAYAWAEQQGYDLDENYLAIDADNDGLSYTIATATQAQELAWS